MIKLADLRVSYTIATDIHTTTASSYRQATVDDLRSVLADPEVQEMLGARSW